MKKEIIKLHSVGIKVLYWTIAVACFSLTVAIFVLGRNEIFPGYDTEFHVFTLVASWFGVISVIVSGLFSLYFVLFCGKIVVDFEKEEITFFNLTFKKRISFGFITRIFTKPYKRGYGYYLCFKLSSKKTIKCNGFQGSRSITDTKTIQKRLSEILKDFRVDSKTCDK